MRWLLLALLFAACGSAPTAPSPQPVPSPAPSPLTATVSLTDTVSGASIGSSTQTVTAFPAQLSFLMPGYVPRQTWIRSSTASIDLIPEAGFDLAFFRQLARNGYEAPSALEPLRVLSQAPSIYLQSAGLSAANVAALENAGRVAVYEFSGRTMGVVSFESGADLRADRTGWITVEIVSDPTQPCGRSFVGMTAGHVWLNTAGRCSFDRYSPTAIAHELGHAMGFWHVSNPDALMFANAAFGLVAPSPLERTHAAIAYHRQPGNRDVDSDPQTAGFSTTRVVID